MTENHEQTEPDDAAAAPASALHAMVRKGSEQRQARVMSLPKALRLTLAKVADDLFAMAAAVIAVRVEVRGGDELEGLFDPGHLLMLLEGPVRRRAGAAFDPALTGALIQQQTMNKVLPALDADPRQPTDTDAAICAPFLDGLIARAAPLPEEAGEQALMKGYEFGARMEDPRLLLMALDAPEFTVVHMTVDVEAGVRQGNIVLCFPKVEAAEDLPPSDDVEDVGKPVKGGSLEKQVLAINADLNVSLTRLRMPLSQLRSLQVGETLDLGVTAFDEAQVQTRDGRKLSRGTLGQIGGMRALQLEHASKGLREPRRRASDREALDLPQVSGDGTGTQIALDDADLAVSGDALPDLPAVSADAGLPDLTDLPDLPDLPDMSDLPGLDGLDALQKTG